MRAISIFLLLTLTSPSLSFAKSEGSLPYTPSRLEWLALELNSNYRSEFTSVDGFSITFIPNAKENAIVIFVQYSLQTDRATMNQSIETARYVAHMAANNHGWASWLNLKEDLRPMPQK